MSRIVMVGNFGLENKGTMRARALPLARALVRKGHTVELLLPEGRPENGPDHDDHGVSVRYLGGNPAGSIGSILGYLLSRRPDVLHSFKPISYAGAAATVFSALARVGLSQTRVVVDTDDLEGTGGWASLDGHPGPVRWFIDRQERWVLRQAQAVTVASRQLQSFLDDLGVARSRRVYLPNGVDAVGSHPNEAEVGALRDRLGLGSAKVVLLYTRFFEYPADRAVRVFAGVRRRIPDARLLVVGRGLRGEESGMVRLVQDAGLAAAVTFTGWVEPNELPMHFALADAAMYPMSDTLVNRTKCPAKLVELLAHGVPVVAEDVGQVGEYVRPGESGFIVSSGDEEAFSAALIGLLADKTLSERIAHGATFTIAERFLWDTLAEGAEAAYERASRTSASARGAYG